MTGKPDSVDSTAVVVVLSGGMDSTTLMTHHAALRHELVAVTVDYGQRHRQEIDAARRIAAHGTRLGAPLEHSWSCYKAGEVHCGTCGTCGTCYERREAFQEAGVADPTRYVDGVTQFSAP
ncbi:7-cyano-7-deazaguanine synthase [Streptomyces sp. NPDC047315]|uniref:7-cyano-7-deazaguanine synthase n=1 Tax=Streptomyces sp. NPDC047315 TaxID=3155142 RepID=UPI0033EFACF9